MIFKFCPVFAGIRNLRRTNIYATLEGEKR